MVENIYALKNKILKHVETETQDMNRLNVEEVGKLVDMVKDLAEAEEKCWEASYYKAVTEAMSGSSGYNQMGYNQPMARQGYSNPVMGYGTRGSMGHDDIIEKLGEEYRNLPTDERMMMKNRILSKLGAV